MGRNFIKLYYDFFDELLTLTPAEVRIFLYLAYKCDVGKQRIILDDVFFQRMTLELDMTRERFRRVLCDLRRHGLIYYDKTYLYISSKYTSRKKEI